MLGRFVSTHGWWRHHRAAKEHQAREFDAMRVYNAIDDEEGKKQNALARMKGDPEPQRSKKRPRGRDTVVDITDRELQSLKVRHVELVTNVRELERKERVQLEAVIYLQSVLRRYCVQHCVQ